MVSDEPFTVRTVGVVTAISLIAMFGMISLSVQIGAAWLLAALLNIGLAVVVGVSLQAIRYRRTDKPQRGEAA